MFLKSITALFVLSFAIGAYAQKISTLTAGNYVLQSGPKHLCSGFSIGEKDAVGKSLNLGPQYSYETRNSNHDTQSDIDENCVFKEQNTREDRAQEVILTRINEEVCGGNVSSRTFSRATITADEIQIRHEIDGAPEYTCLFKKKTK